MTFRKTKRVSTYAGIAWLCLLAFVIIVRATNVALGSVQPEAVALTFMMTLPFTLGITGAVIGGTAAYDYFSGRSRAGANPAA
jgi:hypothetical protein